MLRCWTSGVVQAVTDTYVGYVDESVCPRGEPSVAWQVVQGAVSTAHHVALAVVLAHYPPVTAHLAHALVCVGVAPHLTGARLESWWLRSLLTAAAAAFQSPDVPWQRVAGAGLLVTVAPVLLRRTVTNRAVLIVLRVATTVAYRRAVYDEALGASAGYGLVHLLLLMGAESMTSLGHGREWRQWGWVCDWFATVGW
jgi:hypothetical protein